jgi:hypothetical protein
MIPHDKASSVRQDPGMLVYNRLVAASWMLDIST